MIFLKGAKFETRSMVISLIMLLSVMETTLALSCYACDTDAQGEVCETRPSEVIGGVVLCVPPRDEHCYTVRQEYFSEDGEPRLRLFRSCCQMKNGSPVCPPGPELQVEENELYTIYRSRCDGDLCNTDDGKGNNEDGSNSETLFVEGNNRGTVCIKTTHFSPFLASFLSLLLAFY